MSDLTLTELLTLFYRARRLFVLIFAAIFLISTLVAAHWSRYHAEATVLIEQPEMSASLTTVGNVAPSDITIELADRRISQIEQQVTADESLAEIISSLHLYPNTTNSSNALAANMRKHIALNFISSAMANPAAAQKQTVEQLSAIAFTVGFTYSDPELAKRALDTILDRLINEEARERSERAKEAVAFLDQELADLESSIHEQEARIAKFKSSYGESGPAAMLFNQQAILSSTMTLQSLSAQMATAQANVSALTAQLAITSPYLLDDTEKPAPVTSKQTLQTQLALLQSRYGDAYPDVVKLKQQLQALPASGPHHPILRDANNPSYIQLSSQLSAASSTLAALKAQYAAVAKQQATYQRMIDENPRAEQQMAQLSLDLDHNKERYHALKDKRLTAAMKAKLEADGSQTRLKIIHPSTVPMTTSPPRSLLVVIGFLLALLGACTAVLIREFANQPVRSAEHLTRVLGAPPLATIPPLRS